MHLNGSVATALNATWRPRCPLPAGPQGNRTEYGNLWDTWDALIVTYGGIWKHAFGIHLFVIVLLGVCFTAMAFHGGDFEDDVIGNGKRSTPGLSAEVALDGRDVLHGPRADARAVGTGMVPRRSARGKAWRPSARRRLSIGRSTGWRGRLRQHTTQRSRTTRRAHRAACWLRSEAADHYLDTGLIAPSPFVSSSAFDPRLCDDCDVGRCDRARACAAGAIMHGGVRRWAGLTLLAALLATSIGEALNPGPPHGGGCPFDDPDLSDGDDDDSAPFLNFPCDDEFLELHATAEHARAADPHEDDGCAHRRRPQFHRRRPLRRARPGMAFRVGDLGLGYYTLRDLDEQTPSSSMRGEAVTIALDDLVQDSLVDTREDPMGEHGGTSLGGAEPRRMRTFAKRHRARRRGGGVAPCAQALFRPQSFCSKQGAAHRQAGLRAVDTVNGNCWDGALGFMQATTADLVLSQEAKRLKQQVAAAERTAAASGWTAKVAPAVRTWMGRPSAGVAIAARSHIGISEVPGAAVADDLTSRISLAWVGGLTRGGMIFASLYLHPSEGMTPRNADLLNEVARLLSCIGRPWCIAADWQMPPEALAASGWPN